MARSKAEVLVTQSLLDRLTSQDDWPTTRGSSLSMYRDGIKRDVEWLLNSRRPHVDEIGPYPLANNSVFNYGFPDLLQFSGVQTDSTALQFAIQQTVRTYEPRIRDPRVLLARRDTLNRSLRFHVEGRLMFENGEEEISFDTVLEITSGEYEVK